MKEIKVKITFFEDCLGTASADPEVHANFIASKARNGEGNAIRSSAME